MLVLQSSATKPSVFNSNIFLWPHALLGLVSGGARRGVTPPVDLEQRLEPRTRTSWVSAQITVRQSHPPSCSFLSQCIFHSFPSQLRTDPRWWLACSDAQEVGLHSFWQRWVVSPSFPSSWVSAFTTGLLRKRWPALFLKHLAIAAVFCAGLDPVGLALRIPTGLAPLGGTGGGTAPPCILAGLKSHLGTAYLSPPNTNALLCRICATEKL